MVGLQIRQPQEHFYFGAVTFLWFFTFIAGIALAASGQLAIGLSLLISNVVTTVVCVPLIIFKVVSFPEPHGNANVPPA